MIQKDNDEELQGYLNQIRKIPLLSFEEEMELSRLIALGDKNARSRLIEANLRLVVKIAKSCKVKDVALMDLIQEGNVGLIKAVDKFDHSRKFRFSTYAGWWIRQYAARYLTDKRRAIRLPHRKEEILRRIQCAYHHLYQVYMRRPKLEEIASEVGVPLGEVENVLNMTSKLIPLEMEISGAEGSDIINTHKDYTYCPERALMSQSLVDEARRVLKRLRVRERRILACHYQLNGSEHNTLKKIGDMMGVSPETVRQIEIKAFKKSAAMPAISPCYTTATAKNHSLKKYGGAGQVPSYAR